MIRTWLALSRSLAISAALAAGSAFAQEATPAPASPVSTEAAAAATAPAVVPPLGQSSPVKPRVDAVFELAFQGLAGKAAAVRALRDLGQFSDAAFRAGELAKEWQTLTETWRQQALAVIQKLAAGQASSTEADRAIGLYALGESETQRTFQLLGESLQAAGKSAEQDTVVLDRLRVLQQKSRAPGLIEALRPAVRETENRLLALATGHAARGDHDDAFSLLTRLYGATSSEARRAAVVERMLALYSDLVTARRFRNASRIALWYVSNGDVRAHTWREETLRLVRLMLDPIPICGESLGSGKGDDASSIDVVEIICRFFVNPGTADATVFVLLARAYLQSGEVGDAIRWFRLALEERHHDPAIHVHLARAYASTGLIDESVRSAVNAINYGWPVRWILDDPGLEAIRGTECYLSLKKGSLF